MFEDILNPYNDSDESRDKKDYSIDSFKSDTKKVVFRAPKAPEGN